MVDEIAISLVFVARLQVEELPKPGSLPRPVRLSVISINRRATPPQDNRERAWVVRIRRMVAV
jgi:hypothetical protein